MPVCVSAMPSTEGEKGAMISDLGRKEYLLLMRNFIIDHYRITADCSPALIQHQSSSHSGTSSAFPQRETVAPAVLVDASKVTDKGLYIDIAVGCLGLKWTFNLKKAGSLRGLYVFDVYVKVKT